MELAKWKAMEKKEEDKIEEEKETNTEINIVKLKTFKEDEKPAAKAAAPAKLIAKAAAKKEISSDEYRQ